MCLVFFGVSGWIPMAPELRIAWSPMIPELGIARSPMAPELGIALTILVFGNYQILCFPTHSRAMNFPASAYCRELRYAAVWF